MAKRWGTDFGSEAAREQVEDLFRAAHAAEMQEWWRMWGPFIGVALCALVFGCFLGWAMDSHR